MGWFWFADISRCTRHIRRQGTCHRLCSPSRCRLMQRAWTVARVRRTITYRVFWWEKFIPANGGSGTSVVQRTADVLGTGGTVYTPAFDLPPPSAEGCTYPVPMESVIKVDTIEVDSSDADSFYLNESGGIDNIASVKGSGNITLRATISPDTPETRAVIDWQGATEDASDPLKATLSRSTSTKQEVHVSVTGSSCRQANVWVAWSTFTSFNNTGPTPGDSSVSPSPVAYGASSGTKNGMLIQNTISPSGFGAIANVSYDIKRTKERATWSKTGSTWQQDTHVGPGADDDSHDGDEDLTPSVDEHIYVIDTPGFNSSISFADEAVYKASFVEFVNIKLGSSGWIKCSDDYEWHSITWLEDNGSGTWRRKTSEPNEITPGSTTVGTPSTP